MNPFNLFDNIPGFSRIVEIVEKVINLLSTFAENTDIKERFQRTGKVSASFTVESYEVKFTIEDKRKTAIPADIEEGEP